MLRPMKIHQLRLVFTTVLFCALVLIFVPIFGDCSAQDEDNPKEKEQMPTPRLNEVLRQHTPELMSLPGVEGTALGLCGDTVCIKVFVSQKNPQLAQKIQSILQDYPFEIQQTGKIKALPDD